MKIFRVLLRHLLLAFFLAGTLPVLGHAQALTPLAASDFSGVDGELHIVGSAQTQSWLLMSHTSGMQRHFLVVHVGEEMRLESLDANTLGVNPDDVLYAKTSADKLIFLTPNQAVVFDPVSKLRHQYDLPYSANNPWTEWSEKYHRLIWGTEVLPASGPSRPHAVQTGLVLVDNGAGFVTSGYHDESIRFWNTQNGELVRDVQLSGWFRSYNITSLAVLRHGLLFSTQRQVIHWLAAESAKKTGSFRPCPEAVQLNSFHGPANEQAFYRCQTNGGYGLVYYDTKADKIASIPFSESDGDAVLSAHRTSSGVLVIKRTGDLELCDIGSGQKIRQAHIEGSADMVLLPESEKLARLGESKHLEIFDLRNVLY